MKPRRISFMFAALVLAALPACAQTSAQPSTSDLPSAPSATVQQQQQQARQAEVKREQEDAAEAAAAKAQASQPTSVAPDAPAPAAPQNSASTPASQPPAQDAPAKKNTAQDADDSLLDTGGADVSTNPTIIRKVEEVNLVFTVTDKHGRYIKDLTKQDFSILDDEHPGNTIRYFQSETDLPLQVGLLIDASNSIRDRFKFEQESAVEFLNTTIRRKYDRAFVIGFDVTPTVTQDFTDNTELLSEGIRILRPGGGTALFDALYYACRDKLMKEKSTTPVRKAIILLTDGDDNQSHVTREEAIEMAQRAEVTVYTISTNLTNVGGEGDRVLQRIADATGGRAYTPFQLNDVADAFGKIQEELRSQYALSYHPAELYHDGSYHSVAIIAKNRKGIRIHAKPGYYAPSD